MNGQVERPTLEIVEHCQRVADLINAFHPPADGPISAEQVRQRYVERGFDGFDTEGPA